MPIKKLIYLKNISIDQIDQIPDAPMLIRAEVSSDIAGADTTLPVQWGTPSRATPTYAYSYS